MGKMAAIPKPRSLQAPMFQPAKSIDDVIAPIADGCMLVVPREVSGVPMSATRALIRRGVKRLHLVALPTSSLQADLLIGAGCIETLETSAVSLGEFGPAPRFSAAARNGYDAVSTRNSAARASPPSGWPSCTSPGLVLMTSPANASTWPRPLAERCAPSATMPPRTC